ncbi:MAG: sigma-70 family RNA polymerase sigma factor [Melioribacteraceae bacterium]|nr:sigma-70 family RNA polymerase sigma factor [Melioribacteraceae bacterium]
MTTPEKSSRSDEILVKLIKQNDPDAFKELYYKYYKQLYRYAYFRLYAVETTRDLIQDLFSRVWNNRKNLNPNKPIKSYLYRSLTNIIINHSRLESSKNVSYSKLDEEISGREEELDQQIDIQSAINELPEKLKSVYLLSRVEGYKYKEISEILQISVKAVEKRMSKALILLRKRFG